MKSFRFWLLMFAVLEELTAMKPDVFKVARTTCQPHFRRPATP